MSPLRNRTNDYAPWFTNARKALAQKSENTSVTCAKDHTLYANAKSYQRLKDSSKRMTRKERQDIRPENKKQSQTPKRLRH